MLNYETVDGAIAEMDEAPPVATRPKATDVLAKLAKDARDAMEALADRIDAGESVEADEIRQALMLAGCTPADLQGLVDLRKERRQARAGLMQACESKVKANQEIAECGAMQQTLEGKLREIARLQVEAQQLAGQTETRQAYARMALQQAGRNVSFAMERCRRLGVEI